MTTPRSLFIRAAALAVACLPLLLGGAAGASDQTDADTGYGRMLLVLDSSGSMSEPAGGGTTKIEAAKSALGDVVDALPDQAFVGLRVYGATVFSKQQKGACQDSELVVPPGTDNRDELGSAIDSATPYGETPIAYALRQAADDIGSEGTRSVVLVSDGEATCAPDPCVVAAKLAEKGIDLQIDVVGLSVTGSARSQLRCIAAAGNGSYYDADSADEIADSVRTASDRALRPFELEGKPIEGGSSSIDATPVTSGRWVDTVGKKGAKSGERWFEFERTLTGSTVQVAVTSLGAQGARDADIKVEVTTEDGGSCGTAGDYKQVNAGALLGAGILTGPDTFFGSEECSGDRLLIKVSRILVVDGFAPYALNIVEEPRATNVAALPKGLGNYDAEYVQPSVEGPVAKIRGGGSFGEAVAVSDGAYSGSIVPGETQVFKIDVGYGQQLSARLLTPSASTQLQKKMGSAGPFAELAIFNPLGMRVDHPLSASPRGQAATALPGSLTVGTTEVRYRNRELLGELASMSGTYYVVYGVDTASDGDSYELPFELQVEVQGSRTDVPTYADGQTIRGTTGPEPEPPATKASASASASDRAPTSQASNHASSTPAKLAGAVALLAIAGGCLWVAPRLLRRSTP